MIGRWIAEVIPMQAISPPCPSLSSSSEKMMIGSALSVAIGNRRAWSYRVNETCRMKDEVGLKLKRVVNLAVL